MSGSTLNIHGGCVVIGETGVLITGAAGAGKSALALAILEDCKARGLFAALVADDRVRLSRQNHRLIARPHPRIAGLMEKRGLGIVRLPFEPAAAVSLVVELCPGPQVRMPDPGAETTRLLGLATRHLQLSSTRPAALNASDLIFFLQAQRVLDLSA